jgi:hypothetical protein
LHRRQNDWINLRYTFAFRLSDHLPIPNSHPPQSPVAGGFITESIARLQNYSTGTAEPGIPLHILHQVDFLARTKPYDPELGIEIVALVATIVEAGE